MAKLDYPIKDSCDFHNRIILKTNDGREISILQNNEGCRGVYGDIDDGTVEVWDMKDRTDPLSGVSLDEFIDKLTKFKNDPNYLLGRQYWEDME